MRAPRPHQEQGLTVFRDAMASDRRSPIVFYVTMGGGKTFMYALCAQHAVAQGLKVIVYVPSRTIARGVELAMASLGLKPSVLNRNKAEAFWDSDRNVMISTYAKLAIQPELHATMIRRAGPTLLICDEIHHAGSVVTDEDDPTRYGWGVQCAHDEAAHTIYGTGTPYRTDSRPLPGELHYEPIDGDEYGRSALRADVTLGVGEAIANGYTRDVYFLGYEDRQALVRNRYTKEFELKDFGDVDQSLTKICRDQENWEPILLGVTDTMTEGHRCLVIANDIGHARAIYKYSKERLHHLNPVVVTSDEVGAADDLEIFKSKRSPSKLLITVGMASEGFDCPSLTHLVYVSATRSDLALDQAIGRIIRRPKGGPSEAFAGGLGDKEWQKYVRLYQDQRGLAQKKRMDREAGNDGSAGERLENYGGSTGSTDLNANRCGQESVEPALIKIALKHGLTVSGLAAAIEEYAAGEGDEDPIPEDENSDEKRRQAARDVFGKGGVIPKLNYRLVGKADPAFLMKATARVYVETHNKRPGNKPFPVEVTLEYQRIAQELALNPSTRPSWFEHRLRQVNGEH